MGTYLFAFFSFKCVERVRAEWFTFNVILHELYMHPEMHLPGFYYRTITLSMVAKINEQGSRMCERCELDINVALQFSTLSLPILFI